MNFRSASRRRPEPTIDIMPLVDVVFLLLIFFLITTSFTHAKDKDESSIPIELPSGETGTAAGEGDMMVVSVGANGSVEFDGNVPIEGNTIDEKLEDLHRKKPDLDILLRGDKEATHGQIVEMLDRIKQKGFGRVNLVIQNKK